LNPGAMLLDLCSAGLAQGRPLRHDSDGRHQQNAQESQPRYGKHHCHSTGIPAPRRPGK
jgi:hypothetical protein